MVVLHYTCSILVTDILESCVAGTLVCDRAMICCLLLQASKLGNHPSPLRGSCPTTPDLAPGYDARAHKPTLDPDDVIVPDYRL
jgi:hypothetical protein